MLGKEIVEGAPAELRFCSAPLAPPARFERATFGLGSRCSILLSYGGRALARTVGQARVSSRSGSWHGAWNEASRKPAHGAFLLLCCILALAKMQPERCQAKFLPP